jgi:tetratricopeptide (TPR) repeat protein
VYLELALSLDDDKPVIFKNLLGLYKDVAEASLAAHDPEAAEETLELMAPLLGRFLERWPSAKTEVTPADLSRLRGLVAFEKGKANEATTYFEQALGSEKSVQTFLLLGRVHMLSQSWSKARSAIDKALKIPHKKHGEAYYWKSLLLTLKGDIHYLEGDEEEASAMWRKALDTGMEALPFVPLSLKAEMEARLGLLLHRLGRTTPAIDHLKRSIAGGATSDTYALVLSYLTARGDVEVSDVYYHFASTESKLEKSDQLMFATWYVALHWRMNREVDAEAIELLRDSSTGDWPGPLLAYASGAAGYEETGMSAGSDPVKLVSLLFLRACQLLGEGDEEGASKRLREVLETGLVADPHYAMALETLRALHALP